MLLREVWGRGIRDGDCRVTLDVLKRDRGEVRGVTATVYVGLDPVPIESVGTSKESEGEPGETVQPEGVDVLREEHYSVTKRYQDQRLENRQLSVTKSRYKSSLRKKPFSNDKRRRLDPILSSFYF